MKYENNIYMSDHSICLGNHLSICMFMLYYTTVQCVCVWARAHTCTHICLDFGHSKILQLP